MHVQSTFSSAYSDVVFWDCCIITDKHIFSIQWSSTMGTASCSHDCALVAHRLVSICCVSSFVRIGVAKVHSTEKGYLFADISNSQVAYQFL